jgi:small subunit ribosomal protein S6
MKTYEAMFLLDAGAPDFEAASAPVRDVLARIKAEVLVLKAWDERRLAFEIKTRKRGLYVLAYFNADPSQLAPLQHEVLLDERILRALVLTAQDVTSEKMNAPTPADTGGIRRAGEGESPAEAPAPAPAPAPPVEAPAPAPAPPVEAPVAQEGAADQRPAQ